MHIREFEYDLPADLIAQAPPLHREDGRLLRLSRTTGAIAHSRIPALPELLHPGDLLVANDTRVFPARLLGVRDPSGGAVECLLIGRVSGSPANPPRPAPSTPGAPDTAPTAPGERFDTSMADSSEATWEALMHPGQKLKPGARVVFEGSKTIFGEVLERRFYGRRVIRLWTGDGSPLDAAVDEIGHVPLPPYVKRSDSLADREGYQTVFARHRGSVAAPTAGLHLGEALLAALGARGIETVFITLHVGYGTFQPVRVEEVEAHHVEPEPYEIGPAAAQAIDLALQQGRRVVAVGTTTTRTLETVAREHGGRIVAASGVTDLFIRPGFEFRVIDGLLTNFHLPRSSLLMLVCAFAGRGSVLAAYREAIAERYRFYSYGDAMLIT